MIIAENASHTQGSVGRKKSKGVSIRSVIFGLMMAGSIGPLALYQVLDFTTQRADLMTSIERQIQAEGKTNAAKVQDWIAQQQNFAKAMAQSPVFRSGDLAAMDSFLAESNKRVPDYYGITFIDASGMQVARSKGTKVNVADRPYVTEVMAGAESAIGTGISRSTGTAAFFVSAPVKSADQATPIGVIGAYAHLVVVSKGITGGRVGSTGYSYLVDSSTSEVMAHPESKKVSSKLDSAQTQLMNKSTLGVVVSSTDTTGKAVKAVVHPAGGNLVLVTQIDEEEAHQPLDAIIVQALTFMGGGLLVALVFSLVLSTLIASKIKRLAEHTNEITRAHSIQDIVRGEQAISEVGGSTELREVGVAVKRLTNFIKTAMRNAARSDA